MKEKIIEIIGFNIEPERAELIAQQVLDLFAVSGSLLSDIRNEMDADMEDSGMAQGKLKVV